MEKEVVSQILEGVWKREESTLNLSHREMKVIPADVAKLAHIKALLLNDNCILMPPEEVAHLRHLEILCLEHNQLTVIPSGIAKLSSTLHFLNLSHNPLTTISPAVGHLKNLRSLWLGYTELVSFPQEVCSLSKLTHLSLEGNHIPSITKVDICKLKELRWFSLAKNKLNSVGEVFSCLPCLHTLDLADNHLTQIPVFTNCCALLNLNLRGNRISVLPDDIQTVIAHSREERSTLKLDFRDNPVPEENRPSWTLQENVFFDAPRELIHIVSHK